MQVCFQSCKRKCSRLALGDAAIHWQTEAEWHVSAVRKSGPFALSNLFCGALANGSAIAVQLHEFAMDALLISAAGGMKSRLDSLDMLANNIANTGTAAFKADREFNNLYEEELPVIEQQYTDFSQGLLVATGNPLDLALSGKGLFALNSPSGTVFTRNGSFRISKKNQLESSDGYTLRNVLDKGNPITVDPLAPIDIGKDSVVRQNGQEVGKIEIDSPDSNPLSLSKLGASYFVMDKNATPPAGAAGTELLQGQIEQSNVPVAESAVKLVGVMRQFEMLQRAITLDTEMSKKATDEVAKVV
jgi:flagellar basal-body rod protein FlgF